MTKAIITLEETPDEEWGYNCSLGLFQLNITDESLIGPRARHLAPRHYDPVNVGFICVDPAIGHLLRFPQKPFVGVGVSFSYQDGEWHITERAHLERDSSARVYRKSAFKVLPTNTNTEFDEKTDCGVDRLCKVFGKVLTVPGIPEQTQTLARKLYDALVRKDYLEVRQGC